MQTMQSFSFDVWKGSSINEADSNLLHFFIQNQFQFLSHPRSLKVHQLCFHQNIAGDLPIMAILGQNMEKLAQELWKYME